MDNFGPLVQRFLLEHLDWKPSFDSHCPVGWDPILGQALSDLHDLADRRQVASDYVKLPSSRNGLAGSTP